MTASIGTPPGVVSRLIVAGHDMLPLHRDPHFTFRFADDRIIPRFHLEGVEAGVKVSVYRLDLATGGPLELLATATVGDNGWVDLAEPIIVRVGTGFVAVPDAARLRS